MHVCIKADVMGSAEALVTALKQLEMKNEVRKRLMSRSVIHFHFLK